MPCWKPPAPVVMSLLTAIWLGLTATILLVGRGDVALTLAGAFTVANFMLNVERVRNTWRLGDVFHAQVFVSILLVTSLWLGYTIQANTLNELKTELQKAQAEQVKTRAEFAVAVSQLRTELDAVGILLGPLRSTRDIRTEVVDPIRDVREMVQDIRCAWLRPVTAQSPTQGPTQGPLASPRVVPEGAGQAPEQGVAPEQGENPINIPIPPPQC